MKEGVLRAGVIGLGVGERHIEGYEADPRCRVVALCDTDGEKLREVGARHPGRGLTQNPEQILEDPQIDVVSVASYDNAHRDQIVAALEHGKHVFVEKPLCLFQHELADIARAMGENPACRLSSNLILRRTPRFRELHRRVRAGEMGELYYLEGDYNYGRLHKITEGWRGRLPFYSVVHGGAIHLIDLMLWLTGARVSDVAAFGNGIATRGTSFKHPDLVAALMQFDNGMTAKVTANFASVTPHHHRLSVYGTGTAFTHDHLTGAYFHSRDPEKAPEILRDPYPGTAKGDMIPAFVGHILDGAPPEVSAREVLDAMAVSLAIERALESGRKEKVHYEDNLNDLSAIKAE